MKKIATLLIFVLLIASCSRDSSKTSIQNTSNLNHDNQSSLKDDNLNIKSEKMVAPEKNPRKALEQLGFWNKQYYKLEYNPLYGYCYQHLFPSMDTSQEKDVISFHVKTMPFDPMVIFIVNKVAYKNGEFELSGTINDKKYIVQLKVQDGKTINVRLGEFEINESYDLPSGIAYSSFINT